MIRPIRRSLSRMLSLLCAPLAMSLLLGCGAVSQPQTPTVAISPRPTTVTAGTVVHFIVTTHYGQQGVDWSLNSRFAEGGLVNQSAFSVH